MHPGRALRNGFLERWTSQEKALTAVPDSERPAYQRATEEGDFDNAVVWASEATALIKSIEAAGALVARISAEAETQLYLGAGLLR